MESEMESGTAVMDPPKHPLTRSGVGEITADIHERDILCFTNNLVTIPPELTVVAGFNPDRVVAAGTVVMNVVNTKDGDKTVEWSADNRASVLAAEQLYMALTGEGMVPYAITDATKKGKIKFNKGGEPKEGAPVKKMTKFDAKVEGIVFMPMPQQVGG